MFESRGVENFFRCKDKLQHAVDSLPVVLLLVFKDICGTLRRRQNAVGLVNAKAAATFTDPSAATYDFGKKVAGIVSFDFNSSTDARDVYIGVSFTESSLWINSEGCDATSDAGIDQTLWFEVSGTGHHQASKEHQRGEFRYVNVYHNSTTDVTLTVLSVHFTAVPQRTEADL
ncbi:uncharacterized protein A1O5_02436 [Cladophialophora psammophila CBS 110553]|uniref:PA14 domain-containing protein n=1 Tax=Cladophialophora psammophila CBS 110553 TaxID=1182543 RepID=W9X0Y6_9EURO|nr:uncharacterized protein A1O5_02436 [Cladophialophora psammophila CBS 110553]EXJ74142.1 hypothetical protein A1O5_02436 [Cladophialophora psammophila CBS 110553]